MGLLTPDPGLLFWMVITFGVVFFILAKYGFPVILKTVEDRKAYIDNSLKAAREANEQLANVKVEGEKILAQAREEQHRILSEAAATRDRIIKDAQEKAFAEGNRLMEEMKKQIETEKESAIRDIRRQVAVLSVGIAEKIMRNKLADEKEQAALIVHGGEEDRALPHAERLCTGPAAHRGRPAGEQPDARRHPHTQGTGALLRLRHH